MNEQDWFKVWFRAMPEDWKAGLHAALQGNVFIGNLETAPGSIDPPLAVMFMPLEMAKKIEAFIRKGK